MAPAAVRAELQEVDYLNPARTAATECALFGIRFRK
jgi:hypothetical protein